MSLVIIGSSVRWILSQKPNNVGKPKLNSTCHHHQQKLLFYPIAIARKEQFQMDSTFWAFPKVIPHGKTKVILFFQTYLSNIRLVIGGLEGRPSYHATIFTMTIWFQNIARGSLFTRKKSCPSTFAFSVFHWLAMRPPMSHSTYPCGAAFICRWD